MSPRKLDEKVGPEEVDQVEETNHLSFYVFQTTKGYIK